MLTLKCSRTPAELVLIWAHLLMFVDRSCFCRPVLGCSGNKGLGRRIEATTLVCEAVSACHLVLYTLTTCDHSSAVRRQINVDA